MGYVSFREGNHTWMLLWDWESHPKFFRGNFFPRLRKGYVRFRAACHTLTWGLFSWEPKGTPPMPPPLGLIKALFLGGGWHSGGTLRFPWFSSELWQDTEFSRVCDNGWWMWRSVMMGWSTTDFWEKNHQEDFQQKFEHLNSIWLRQSWRSGFQLLDCHPVGDDWVMSDFPSWTPQTYLIVLSIVKFDWCDDLIRGVSP